MSKLLNFNTLVVSIIAVAVLSYAMLASAGARPKDIVAQDAAPSAAVVEVTQAAKVVEYTVRTQLGGEKPMAFVGVGGVIEGIVNPNWWQRSVIRFASRLSMATPSYMTFALTNWVWRRSS